jgi:hypothetical protein
MGHLAKGAAAAIVVCSDEDPDTLSNAMMDDNLKDPDLCWRWQQVLPTVLLPQKQAADVLRRLGNNKHAISALLCYQVGRRVALCFTALQRCRTALQHAHSRGRAGTPPRIPGFHPSHRGRRAASFLFCNALRRVSRDAS